MENPGKPLEASCSPVLHAPVTVTNVNNTKNANILDATEKMKLAGEDPCATPKKKPAKTVLKKEKETDGANANTNNANSDDASFQEFLARVKLVAQQDTRSIPTFAQLSSGMPSPQRNNFAMPPEYAKYEARIQRALSRGNSCNSLNNVSMSPHSHLSSPGAEWVAGNSRSVERGWNEDTLIARHAFPSSIFCTRPANSEDSTPSPESSLDMSDVSGSGQDHSRRRSVQQDSKVASMPDVPALSGVSSSSWSEEEQMGVRKFIQLLEQSNSFSSSQPSPVCRRAPSPPEPKAVESEPTLIEISPRVSEPLRRADETVTAVRHDFYVPVSCFGCSHDIFCIADAKYVICPSCRVVSPIEEGALEGRSLNQHGLGLGFTCESLFQIQSEILSER